MRRSRLKYRLAALLSALPSITFAEEIGSVDTVFKIFGPDHKIVVEAFDDPDVDNVTCYLSRSKGRDQRGLGLAEDTSDAAISCQQQVGPIELNDRVKRKPTKGQVVFQKRTSLVFKNYRLYALRSKRNALIYLTYSDKMIDGSPKNALSAVPIMPW
ncbi:CreA family protein [Providencia rettgeri]|uniref:CreA family protein n=1 Tax=Providencia rettgeri TaxID=587 RepID=A0A939NC46_PRORE|nr:CreA family protein [Providencia rettgeri]